MPRSSLRPQSAWTQLADLTLIQLSNWRWSWRSTVIVGMLGPLGSILGLGAFAREAGQTALAHVFVGSLVLGLMFETVGKVSSNFAYMRAMGTLDYFATLPIQRHLLVLASVLAFFVLALPAFLVTMLVGSLALGLRLVPSPFLLIVVPLSSITLAGIGALIGVAARQPQEANALSLLVTLGLTALGPVMIPPDRLPTVMLALGRLSPATYAASALRQALLGPIIPRFILDVGALLVFAVAFLMLVRAKMEWRQDP